MNKIHRRGANALAILLFLHLATQLFSELYVPFSPEPLNTVWLQPNHDVPQAPISKHQYGLSHISFASVLEGLPMQPTSHGPIVLSRQAIVSIHHFTSTTNETLNADRFFYLLEKTVGSERSKYIKKTIGNYEHYTQQKNRLTQQRDDLLSSHNTNNNSVDARYRAALRRFEYHVKVENLQQQLFSKEEIKHLFGEENAQARYFLNRKITTLNPALSEAERSGQLDNLARNYHATLKASDQAAINNNRSTENLL